MSIFWYNPVVEYIQKSLHTEVGEISMKQEKQYTTDINLFKYERERERIFKRMNPIHEWKKETFLSISVFFQLVFHVQAFLLISLFLFLLLYGEEKEATCSKEAFLRERKSSLLTFSTASFLIWPLATFDTFIVNQTTFTELSFRYSPDTFRVSWCAIIWWSFWKDSELPWTTRRTNWTSYNNIYIYIQSRIYRK